MLKLGNAKKNKEAQMLGLVEKMTQRILSKIWSRRESVNTYQIQCNKTIAVRGKKKNKL